MVRGLSQHLRPVLASLNSFASGQAVAQYAVPALAGGILGGGKRITTPLSEPLAGVDIPKSVTPPPAKVEAGKVLDVKAAAVDSAGPTACVGLFVSGGSAAETPATAGAAKVLEYLAFTATSNRTTFRLYRELEKYGAKKVAVAGRDFLGFSIEASKLHAAEVTEILLDAVLNARLTSWEVNDLLPHIIEEVEAAYLQPGVLARELMHKAAFTGGLSQPLLPDAATVGKVTADTLLEYLAAVVKPQALALVGSGVPLKLLTEVAAPLLPSGSGGAPAPSSSYTGGVLTSLSPTTPPTVGVAFEANGGLGDLKAAASAAVVKVLLNATRESVPFQYKEAGGVLTSLEGFAEVYKTTGLLGLIATTTPGSAAAAVDDLTSRFESLAKGVDGAAVAAAKGVVLGGYSGDDARTKVVQDMGLQLLARGAFSSQEFVSAVSGLSAGDITKYVGEAIKGQPTLVAAGPLSGLPKFDAVAKRFK